MTEDTTEYRLAEDVQKIRSAGVMIEGDDTVELDLGEAREIEREHGEVLEPVDGGGEA